MRKDGPMSLERNFLVVWYSLRVKLYVKAYFFLLFFFSYNWKHNSLPARKKALQKGSDQYLWVHRSFGNLRGGLGELELYPFLSKGIGYLIIRHSGCRGWILSFAFPCLCLLGIAALHKIALWWTFLGCWSYLNYCHFSFSKLGMEFKLISSITHLKSSLRLMRLEV